MARGYNASRYQYETSPRKLQPDYRPTKKQYPKKSTARKTNKAKSTNVNKKNAVNTKTVLYIAFLFAILFTISYRNALISEEFGQVKKLKDNLAVIEKQNEQLKVNIEGATNLGTVEKKASENLGMKKLSEDQTIYVDTPKQDYIEVSKDEVKLDQESWFEKIINKIKSIF